jgi:nitric oxide reductase NorD protein
MSLNIQENIHYPTLFSRLAIADPETAGWVRSQLEKKRAIPDAGQLSLMEETIIFGLSQETDLGRAIAEGFLLLAENPNPRHFEDFSSIVLASADNGPALATILAKHLALILSTEDPALKDRFLQTVAALRHHGTYTLKSPFEILPGLLERQGPDGGAAYLALLLAAFERELAYDRCKILIHLIPRAVAGFSDKRSIWQIKAFRCIMAYDNRLTEPFLTGMAAGVAMLKAPALHRFVSMGLEKARESISKAERFLSLESRLGIETFQGLRVGVALGDLSPDLSRYLRARVGIPIVIRSLTEIGGSLPSDDTPTVQCDGEALYVPSEMEALPSREENVRLYKQLVKMEAGLIEFGTFDFDLDRFRRYLPDGYRSVPWAIRPDASAEENDLTRFFNGFQDPELAQDLFTVFEHGRIRILTAERYPGMWEQLCKTFKHTATTLYGPSGPTDIVERLYWTLSLGFQDIGQPPLEDLLPGLQSRFFEMVSASEAVEASAGITVWAFPAIKEPMATASGSIRNSSRPRIPFNRRIRPDLFFKAHHAWETLSLRIKNRLAENKISVHRADVRKTLKKNNGTLDRDTLKDLIQKADPSTESLSISEGTETDWTTLLGEEIVQSLTPVPDSHEGEAFWYREWDERMQDYLNRHTRVVERRPLEGENDFYGRVLENRWALVGRIRHAFELMRPEGLVILRPWMEGDSFDYRALVDAAIDRRIGRIPSERLYIHRLKHHRDVAVLLLVDLSRSTANKAAGSDQSVLEVEKESMVLFCEALSVLGDRFSVAGFSGNGRLAVEYLRVKDFDEDLSGAVKTRIGSLTPRRSTRMGAAIRHATARIQRVPAKVRLLMIIGDGFPNDTEYKKNHAVADTRRSIAEARSLGIHTHAITVNMTADPQLDEVYGRIHHSVISDVRELPEKLHRIYSRLTR